MTDLKLYLIVLFVYVCVCVLWYVVYVNICV